MARSLLPVAASPGNNLKAYLNFIKKIEVLSPLAEQQLALKWHEEGDINAAQSLVMAHLRFVVHIARSYAGYGLPLSDLIQEGNIGLMEAVKRFDPHRGVRLITFAIYWIKAHIYEYIFNNWRIVKMGTTKNQRKLFFNLRSNRQRLSWLTEKEVRAIAKDLEVPKKDVRDMEARLLMEDASLDYGLDDDEEEVFAPANRLETEDMQVKEEENEWEELLHQALTKGLNELDETSKRLVEARWLDPNKDKQKTLKQFADEMNISPERVRQIEQDAFNKIRAHLRLIAKEKPNW